MNFEKSFLKLEDIRNKLEGIDYSDVKNLIIQALSEIPFSIAKIKVGTYIDRARYNVPPAELLFMDEKSISYITDKYVIDNCLTDYGRANKQHEVIFYGAIESTEIPDQRATAVYEKSELLDSNNSVNIEGELYTISSWEVIKEFEVVEMVFSDIAVSMNPDTCEAFNFHFKKMFNNPNREFFLRQLRFFSEEFARNTDSPEDYKISVAYTDFALNLQEYLGIVYPSVKSDYKGQNIALKPEVIDTHLELKKVYTIRLHKNKAIAFLNNHKYVSDFGTGNSSFTWVDFDKTDKLTEEQVKEQLKL